MDTSLRQFVRERANSRCEYCHIHVNELVEIAFHIEHIVAIKHGGSDEPENLALACDRCNLHKGSNLAGIDADTGQLTPLFNPRSDSWDHHFQMIDSEITGRTSVGRTTVHVLQFNSPRRALLRRLLNSKL